MSAPAFRARIRAAIADEQLQSALDANAQRRMGGRAVAFASLPDLQERRKRAHAVRAEVMERLPEMLADFTAHATKNGMQVQRASDAAHALRLVLDIAENSGVANRETGPAKPLLFAKSKSMVSEEIELNKVLEGRGHRVVETDLGEYIVQLRGEKPAHIITPAVHLHREQVGQLFTEKLGLPYTDDIPTLTAEARRVLREVFLRADVGISGVNFGVAETGGICIVTNEGNGRMVTSVPRVHIALMGMERLVPTLNDLALMLSLLPRSATGQKLSVYTQLIHSPRREGEVDGALERHLIILDNGRSSLWDSDAREALYCIRCGACLNACPVFREVGGHAYVSVDGEPAPYPGPIGSVVSPGLLGLATFGHLAQASSLCGACKDACPVDIDLPRLLTRIRAGAPERGSRNRGIGLSSGTRAALAVYGKVAASARVFAAAQKVAAIGARLISPRSEWMRVAGFTGWGLSKDLPRPAIKSFRARWVDGQEAAPVEVSIPGGAEPTMGETPKNEAPGIAEATAERFSAELKALGATVKRVRREDLAQELIEVLRSASIRSVQAWEQSVELELPALEQAGIRVVQEPDPAIMAGLTGCSCAIAETGTLVLTSGGGKPLSASLLPEIHIAVVGSSQIVPSLEEALRNPEVREASASVLVTGPSRTADIEMTLSIGVHGPKELYVLVAE